MSQPSGVSPYVLRGPVAHELHAFRLAVIFLIIYITLIVGFGAYFMVRAFNRVDSAATTATKIQTLQQTQADNSATGRTLLVQLAALSAVIAEQTGPTTTAVQQAKVGIILGQLTDGIKALNADQLRKISQLAECAPCSPQQVSSILAEPVPVITFGPPAAFSPVPSPLPAERNESASRAGPTPTLSPALNVQVQCLVVCPSPKP